MQLKKLKKRLSKQSLITRDEKIIARKFGMQKTQDKDILYSKITKSMQKEIHQALLGND